ncbi:hypothetical protein AYO40_05505 [Planctomycetaceae bacterium SCGC AG-212-D15]|nr:hypothetical protein AYO40_05505 [Planctomycetaceae bacterium SCGC AG-212-D15]
MAKVAASAKPVVVFHGAASEEEGRVPRVLMAVFFSFLLNGVVIGALFVGGTFLKLFDMAASASETTNEVVEADIEKDQPAPNLENDEIGLDPTVQTNYNVDRIEEVSVPGPVNKDEQVGIPGGTDPTPSTIPPPPGVGGNVGHGAGIDDMTKFGAGGMNGLAGGLGGKMIPGGFGGRSGSTRVKMLTEGGGNTFSEAAVAAGLVFMAQHQATDGHWSFKDFAQHGRCNCTGQSNHDDIAATAFGLLPFLGAGQTHKGGSASGNKYTKQVDLALKYLVLKQNREGEFHPLMYSQGLATMAVCEAYGLTSDPALRGPAQRALNYIIDGQTLEGGWRYAARHKQGATGYDGSICGWQLMALKSGQMSGLTVPAGTLNRCKKWLDDAGTPDGGAYGYTSRGEGINTTAVGLLCRQYLGWGPRNPGLLAGVKRIQNWKPQPSNMYFSYYATQVMHHLGGPGWDAWNPVMRDSLIAAQDKGQDAQHAHQKGSWFHNGSYAGRIMDTSLSILTLEVYYRHLPLYRRDVGADKDVLADK